MGFFTKNDLTSLKELYTQQLQYLLSTENQIVKGMAPTIAHADDEQLKQALKSHLQESEVHVTRLEKLIADLKHGEADSRIDVIITALIGSAANIVSESKSGPVRDAGLIATAQKIEHYEIASYGAAVAWAKTLGLSGQAEVLQKTLDEEKHADHLLYTIADRANTEAAVA